MIISSENKLWQRCYLCQSKRIKSLYKNKDLAYCKDCSFIFFKKIPSSKDLDDVYSNYSRETYITNDSITKIKKELSKIIEKYNVSSVLDIACGECYSLDILKEINPKLELFATEHESARNNVISKGYSFVEGEFFPKLDKKVDLIIFTEAIEHINDVNDFLIHAYSLLKPDGIIYITTPNFVSVERAIMGSNWGMIKPPEHLSYFSPKTLNKALVKNNFKKINVYTENISIFRIIEYLNKLRKNSSKKVKHSPQAASDKMQTLANNNLIFSILKDLINFFLYLFGIGSSIKAIYKK